MKKLLMVVLLTVGMAGHGEPVLSSKPIPAGVGGTQRQESIATATAGRVIGEIQLRPSWGYGKNEFHTEDTLDLGYQFSPFTSVDYLQYLNTGLLEPNGIFPSGPPVVLQDGFLRGRFRRVWENVANDLNLDIETRVYVPTHPVKRDAGMIVGLRNILSLTKRFSRAFALTLQEMPVFYAYGRNGTAVFNQTKQDYDYTSNPDFEDRLYLVASVDLASKWNLSFPLMFWATHFRSFNSAANHDGGWGFTLMVWPELTYQLAQNTSVGLSYYSGNLIQEDLSAFNFGGANGGLTRGVGQFVFRQTL
jgi:hypothetical protein